MFKPTSYGAAIFVAAALASAPAAAVPVVFTYFLSGANEAPPNASPATGYGYVVMDLVAHTMEVVTHFSGLTGPNTAAHIHCCTALPGAGIAGVATTTPTFTGFPAGTAGDYDHLFDMTLASSFRSGFITANGGTPASAEAALYAGMVAGKSYLNIHTQQNPGGEIRGFLPEPGSYAMVLGALALLAATRRRRT